ncbi:MAG: sensor histidine kinase, partial [Chitinophagaceae bacterium]
ESWFLVILLFVTGLIIYLIQIFRLQQKMKLQKLRLHIARDLHDDVGSALGSINLLSQTAGRKLKKPSTPEEISGTLEKIGFSAQTTLEAMDDIIWAINPEKDTWQDLLIRMKEFAFPLTEAKEIFLDLNSDAGDYNKLPVFLRRNVFLIFKEVITNSVKHANSSKIQVDIKVQNDRFFMMIKDDGKGFDINNKNNRNGIHNLHNRAALVKGKLEIISSSGKGTTIKFYCPLR